MLVGYNIDTCRVRHPVLQAAGAQRPKLSLDSVDTHPYPNSNPQTLETRARIQMSPYRKVVVPCIS